MGGVVIDLVLRAAGRAALVTWLKTPPHALLRANNELVEGVALTPWNGTGRVMSAAGKYDADGNETTPPTFLTGYFALCRIHGPMLLADKLTPAVDDPDKAEQWARSKLVRYVKTNGTSGTAAGVPYHEIDGVRVVKAADFFAWLATNGSPGHEWFGGNEL